MTQSKHTKRALLASILSVVLCVAMLVGSTFAWFTDSVTSGNNKIVAGNLDVKLEYSTDLQNWEDVDTNTNVFKDGTLWEPGYTEVVYLRVSNAGSLALKYKFAIHVADKVIGQTADGKEIDLSNFIKFGVVAAPETAYSQDAAGRAAAREAVAADAQLISAGYSKEGAMVKDAAPEVLAMVVYMPEDVGNEANHGTGKQAPSIDMGISLVATQDTVEEDSFGNDYDEDAVFPWDGVTMTEVVPDEEGNYPVSSAAELAWMAHEINELNINEVTIVLQKDIDLNGKAWTPIGGDGYFTGTFDGNGHIIKNLTASKNEASSDPTRGIALFGYVEDAVIKNVKFENVQTQGRYSVAAVVGDGAGELTFENIEILSGSIQSNQNDSRKTAQVAGGILGQGWGNSSSGQKIIFKNCINWADVTVNKQHAGGLWGSITTASYVDVTVENCHNYGNITSLSQDNGGYAGGLGGYFSAKSLTITGCTNNGTVKADQYLGDFVGYSTLANGSVNE